MKDIDFDELDRAVSSVLEPVASKTPASEPAVAPAEPTADSTIAAEKEAPEPATEAVPAPVVAAEPTTTTTPSVEPAAPVAAAPPATRTPLAIKRRGQFMDVVHPSSDMTNKPEDTTAASSARKINLKPLNTSVVATSEPESTTPDVEEASTTETVAPTAAATESQAPVESVEPTPADRVMPDPLDVMETQEEAKEASLVEASTIEDTPVDATGELEADTVPDEDEATPATPFLTDTKVDKRPLDAFSGEEAAAELAAEPAVAPEEPLPPELQADVIAVESNPSERTDEEAKDPADEKKDEADTGFNASIPQQYTPTETKADDDHSIFDTHEYHQPITPTKAKKGGLPGWIVAVLVIFLLAGLGAAGGYFWFYYGI